MDRPRNTSAHLREIDRDTWDQFWPRVDFANMLQSWEYGDAKAVAEGWRPVRFLIVSDSGAHMALAQVLVRAWPFIGGIARLNRGPLLIDAELTANSLTENKLVALDLLLREARRRHWWVTFVAPELEVDDYVAERLASIGLRNRHKSPWASARLSLHSSEQSILANLNGKWRNMLRKAQKSELIVQHREARADDLERLLACYQEMQRDKGFSGVSEKLLRELSKRTGPSWRFDLYVMLGTELSSTEWTALLVTVTHGDTTTYLIAYTNEIGRKVNANYLMLWRAILDAKNAGCSWFDLGGINENTKLGVAHFKKGVNASCYRLTGEYRY
jgi:lipid II:glycine glycyltransferase (peptidoglycan interpeptide bridge formation enzyme)